MNPQTISAISNSNTDHRAQEISLTDIESDVLDIQKMVENHKQNSLTYQLLKAITRHSNDLIKPNDNNNHEFDVQELAINLSQSIEFAVINDVANVDGEISFSFEFEASQQINLSVFIDQNQSININATTQQSFELDISVQNQPVERADPLVLNLDNSDFSFDSQLIQFDLNADGELDYITQLSSGNSYLALDKNQNGIIDNGAELFGDALGSKDGFVELSLYDDNQDGLINANDRIFQHLLLLNFTESNSQKIVELASTDVNSISLNKTHTLTEYNDNLLIARSEFTRRDGSTGTVGDFLLTLNK